MPGIARKGIDRNVGHASPTPNPFHNSPGAVAGQTKVKVNGFLAMTNMGSYACGDNAVGGSAKVTAGGFPVHRLLDATSGHGSFPPNACASGSLNVIAF
jgi:uncharacterized Zn-binding protein involved in type VI secretion